MPYQPTKLRRFYSLDDATQFLEEELRLIAQAMQEVPVVPELFREPTRPRTGMLVLADGTEWDPGAGRGVYYYTGSAWQRLEETP